VHALNVRATTGRTVRKWHYREGRRAVDEGPVTAELPTFATGPASMSAFRRSLDHHSAGWERVPLTHFDN